MNRKKKIAYIRYLVSFDRNERLGGNSDRTVVGDKSVEPRLKDTKK